MLAQRLFGGIGIVFFPRVQNALMLLERHVGHHRITHGHMAHPVNRRARESANAWTGVTQSVCPHCPRKSPPLLVQVRGPMPGRAIASGASRCRSNRPLRSDAVRVSSGGRHPMPAAHGGTFCLRREDAPRAVCVTEKYDLERCRAANRFHTHMPPRHLPGASDTRDPDRTRRIRPQPFFNQRPQRPHLTSHDRLRQTAWATDSPRHAREDAQGRSHRSPNRQARHVRPRRAAALVREWPKV